MKRMLGFVGLGIMGKPMAKNLLKAGFPLVVSSRSQGPVEELTRAGASPAFSPREVAERSSIVLTMLPDSADVQEVILEKSGVMEGIKPGGVIIDMSSINPNVTKRIASQLDQRGIDMLDAPVSGGETGAIQGTLSIMVGGKRKIFHDCLEIFQAMGKNIVYLGNIGAGGYAKLVNQLIVALNIAAIGEAFTLGVKAGLEPGAIHQAIRNGLAGSAVLDAKMPMISTRNFKPGFKIRLHLKDLTNALTTAQALGIPLPLSSLIQQILVSLIAEGRGEDDHSAMATFFERLGGVEIKNESNPLR